MSAAVQQVQAPAWDNVREQLRGLLGEETFGRWFQTVTASIEEENGVYMLQIAAPNRFQRDWLRDNYRSTIEGLWRNLEPDGTVVFTVRETPEPERNLPVKFIHFPLFPSETRPVSNDMARSALFACVQGKDRQMLEDALLATVEGVEIRFTGRQFNQDDHDLLIQLVFMAKHKPLGEYVTIPARAILKALGRTTGGKDYKRLEKDIERLVNSGVSLRDTRRKFKYIGHLIDDAAQDEASRYWAYKFNPRLRALYDPGMYTLVD